MTDWKCIFDGWGTAIVVFILDSIVSGFVGYKIGCRVSQKQKAGDNSTQIQSMNVDTSIGRNDEVKRFCLSQKQEAGDNANQVQTGDIRHGDK